MSSYFTDQRDVAVYSVDFDTADAEAVLSAVSGPLAVFRIFIQLTEAASAADSVVTVGTRLATVAPGGDVSTSYGTFNIPTAGALGDMYVINVAGVTATAVTTDGGGVSQPSEVTTGRVVGRQEAVPGAIEVNVGESFVVQSNGAGTGANAIVHIEYARMIGENTGDPVDTVAELTFTRT